MNACPSGKRKTLMCLFLTSTNDRHNSCRTVIILAKQMMIQLSSSRRLIYEMSNFEQIYSKKLAFFIILNHRIIPLPCSRAVLNCKFEIQIRCERQECEYSVLHPCLHICVRGQFTGVNTIIHTTVQGRRRIDRLYSLFCS